MGRPTDRILSGESVTRHGITIDRDDSGRWGRVYEHDAGHHQVLSVLDADCPPDTCGRRFARGQSEEAIAYVCGWRTWATVRRAWAEAVEVRGSHSLEFPPSPSDDRTREAELDRDIAAEVARGEHDCEEVR